jgi:heme/copper-type cytochrome/quinol oxidase subunit 4
MGETVVRIGKALLIHVLIGIAVLGTIWFMADVFEDASLELQTRYQGANDNGASVLNELGYARSSMVSWAITALALSWLSSSLFIFLGQRRAARGYAEGGSLFATWIGLFILALIAATTAWWRQVSLLDIGTLIASSNYAKSLVAGFVGTALAYYLATGLAVRLSLKRSVPLADVLLPNFWN